jgi:hypothetical protein
MSAFAGCGQAALHALVGNGPIAEIEIAEERA